MKRKTKKNKASAEAIAAYLCLAPSIVGLTFLTYLPLLAVFIIGFFKWKGISAPVFVGLENYIKLFTTDPYFKDSIKVTIYFSVISVLGSIIYSLVIAMLLNRKIPARGFLRAVFYLPYILPSAAVYIGWSWLYESNFGLFNFILKAIGVETIMFLNDSSTIIPSLAFIAVWLSGNLIVIFLAGLQSVPKVYHEAAQIDGAGAFARFIHVTLPSMSPIIFYNLLMSLITNMQVITPSLSLTGSGPGNSTMFMSYLMYHYAFRSNQLGYASAISFVFFILIAIFTAILFTTSKTWVFEEGSEN